MPASLQRKITSVVDVLVARGVANKQSILGCNSAQIAEIEADVGCKLPLAYREFLAHMGCGAGDFYLGTDMFYPRLTGLTQEARNLVANDKTAVALPEDAIVFAMHQGYQFLFLKAGDGDDPGVYYYMEQSGRFEKKSDALTEFLFSVAHDDW